MKTYSYAIVASLLGAAVLALTGPARAASVETTMDKLITGGSQAGGITIGDKLYSDFTFDSTGDAPVAASAVGVSLTSDSSDNHYQIRFNFAQDPLDASAVQTTDVVIQYKVNVLGSQLINGVGLAFDGSVTGGNGDASASVVESILSTTGDVSPLFPGQNQVDISVFNDGSSGLPDSNNVSLAVHPTRELQFRKDITVSSRAGGGRVLINTVDNTLDQVPEPSSAAVLLGAGALLLSRRRRGAVV